MTDSRLPRRRIVAGLGLGAATLTAMGATAAASAEAPARWQPTFEPADSWLERPSRHRMVFDATSPGGAGEALVFADNFFLANQSDYKIGAAELSVVIILRHMATPFAYNDAMWAKYGAPLSEMMKFPDPETRKAPAVNLYNAKGRGKLANRGITLETLIAQGVQFAVCGMATAGLSGAIAKKLKLDKDTVHKDILANLIGNAHLAAAGIVAVGRAQEHGYALAYVG
ncbi:MAG: hypothetical protein KGJ81_03285 [Alphaproteobacteria bacterium]|nr:hypothetical protein [Alphaproteobacteria bacterium]